jgi:hypothetical protein
MKQNITITQIAFILEIQLTSEISIIHTTTTLLNMIMFLTDFQKSSTLLTGLLF